MEDEDEDNADGDGDDEVVEGGADDEDGADGADVFIMLRKKLCGILRFVSLGLLPGADEIFELKPCEDRFSLPSRAVTWRKKRKVKIRPPR